MNPPPVRQIPFGGNALRELAFAINGALSLPKDVTELSETSYLRVARRRATPVIFGLRRILSDREVTDDDVMAVVSDIRWQTGQDETSDSPMPPDPYRRFLELILRALIVTPGDAGVTSDQAYRESVLDRTREVIRACRLVLEDNTIEARHLDGGIAVLEKPGDDDSDEADGAGPQPAMLP